MEKSLKLIGTGDIFLNRTPMAQGLRTKIYKWSHMKLKVSVRQKTFWIGQICHLQMGKIIFSNPTSYRGLISEINKDLKKSKSKNPNKTILKMGYKAKQRIHNKRILNGWGALKKCPKSLFIREMKINMILRFYLKSIIMAKIKNSSDSTCW